MQRMAYQPSHVSNSEDKCQINVPCKDNGRSDGQQGPPISPHRSGLRLQKNRGELPQLKGTTITNAMWMAM